MLKTTEFDASEYIRNDADAIGLLEAAAEEGDPAVIQAALGARVTFVASDENSADAEPAKASAHQRTVG
jgi:DNA-binding phage protein